MHERVRLEAQKTSCYYASEHDTHELGTMLDSSSGLSCTSRGLYSAGSASRQGRYTRGARGRGGKRVCLVVVGLQVCIIERLVETLDDGHETELGLEGQSVGNDISSSQLDSLFEKIMFENDETGIDRSSIIENSLEIRENLRSRHQASGNVKVIGIEGVVPGRIRRPDNRDEIHRTGNGTHTIIDVTKRWAEEDGSHSGDIFDDLFGPAELGDDLIC